jgi:hypothetical protein
MRHGADRLLPISDLAWRLLCRTIRIGLGFPGAENVSVLRWPARKRGEIALHGLESTFHYASHVQPHPIGRVRDGWTGCVAPLSRLAAH